MSNGNELKKASIADLPCLQIGQKQCLCEISCEDCIESHVLAEGYRKQSGWISVEERLPEQYGLFLIADDKGNMEVASWTKQFGWFSGGNRVKRVTHWMPLPEPPKMKEGAE